MNQQRHIKNPSNRYQIMHQTWTRIHQKAFDPFFQSNILRKILFDSIWYYLYLSHVIFLKNGWGYL
jgi:hypothetical protein